MWGFDESEAFYGCGVGCLGCDYCRKPESEIEQRAKAKAALIEAQEKLDTARAASAPPGWTFSEDKFGLVLRSTRDPDGWIREISLTKEGNLHFELIDYQCRAQINISVGVMEAFLDRLKTEKG